MKDGGPAFPQPCTDQGYAANTPYDMAGGGMSLCDYFAAKAMQGVLANSEVEKFRQSLDEDIPEEKQIEAIATTSYEIADAMIAAREAVK